MQSQLSQNLLPISQVASAICCHARSLAQSSSRSHRRQPKKLQLAAAECDQLIFQTEATLRLMGLAALPRDVSAATLSPLLACSHRHAHPTWWQTYTSANTFFENKHGISQKELSAGLLSRTMRWHPQRAGQQVRTFYQRSGRDSHGIGLGKVPVEKLSFGEWMSRRIEKPTPEHDNKMKNLVLALKDHPHLQSMAMDVQTSELEHRKDKDGSSDAKNFKRLMRWSINIVLLYFLIKIVTAGAGGMSGFRLNMLGGVKQVNPEEIDVTFKDVKGNDETKQELMEVVDFLSDPDKFYELGAKLPKGVLLVGRPGTGKTLLARAVAGEAGVPFFYASGSEFDEMFVGTGAARVRQLFKAAKEHAPCVVFIDEIDSVGAKRTSNSLHPYANQTINQLLAEMDGFTQNEGVIVLGATNRKGNLDTALLRPGRFDVEVTVGLPDLKGRTEIIELYLSKIRHDGIDARAIAKGTAGCTGADLENIVNQSALKAAIDGCSLVTMDHVEFAKDKLWMGRARSQVTDLATVRNTAYHEAGHTLVAYFTPGSTPIHKVTIIPRGPSLGHTKFQPDKEEYNKTYQQLLAAMDVAMGGRVAEELIFGKDHVTTGASGDFSTATQIATSMVKEMGMSELVGTRVFSQEERDLSPAMSELIDSEIKRLLQESYERARTLLVKHSKLHHALSEALLEHETLEAHDVQTVMEGREVMRSPPPPPPQPHNVVVTDTDIIKEIKTAIIGLNTSKD